MPFSFFGFLTARASTSLANAMLTISIGWHLYQNSGDPFDLALVGMMQITPIFLFFFATGWVVDSLPRKLVLIICTIFESFILVGISVVMLDEQLNLLFIFGLLFLHGSVKAFYSPAQQAIIPNIVGEEYVSRAVALNATIGKIFSTAGPLLAGILITLVDTYTYMIAAAFMVISSVSYSFLPKLKRMKPTGRSLEMVLGGISYVRSNSIVLGAIALDLFIVLLGSVMTLLPVYAADILKVGPEALGMLRAMPAFGGVIIGLTLAVLPPYAPKRLMPFIALAVFSASITVFALSTIYWLSLIALFVYGAADMVSVNIRMTLIQLATPDHLRGRVSAVNSIFISSSNEMGDVRAGSVAAIFGPVATVFAGGMMALGITVGGWYLFPKLRNLDKLTDASPDNDLDIQKVKKMTEAQYVPPKTWIWDAENGGTFANINRPVSGATHDKDLPVGSHKLQLYSLATPNGVKVTVMLEELLALGVSEAEYDAWLIRIRDGDQFGSGFVEINPNSKIPALMDHSTTPPTRVFESGAILLYLAEKFGRFLPAHQAERAECLSWLFWQMGSAPYLGGGFGHFYAYAPERWEYPINRFTMETKRQLDVLDRQLANRPFISCDDYTIADIAIWAWYGQLVLGRLYNAAEFLDAASYKNVVRWAETIDERPAVRRGRMVNRISGELEMQLHERHDASDFNTKTADKLV